MIEVAIMIEGQNGLNWERWKRIARTVEDAGFAGLYRSDHYTNSTPPDKDSLELWASLTWLASHTERIEFGSMVTPLSFRDPTMTARMAAAVDDLSGGRLTLGLGAGWQEREHNMYGWDLLEVPERFQRFEEGLEIVQRLLARDEPSSFEGDYYQLRDGILLPRPQRPGGPQILIGGNGSRRTLPLAARFATEWNAVYLPPTEFKTKCAELDLAMEQAGRKPDEIKRSMMTGVEFGRDPDEVTKLVNTRTQGKLTPQQLHERGLMVGTAGQIVEQLGKLDEAGCQRVMLQWLALDDIDRLEALGSSVLAQLKS
jgi:F420-dependent oxidoreductase-like protein